jgi:hypothetical protein
MQWKKEPITLDDDLMIDNFSHDKELMDFLGVEFEEPSLFETE